MDATKRGGGRGRGIKTYEIGLGRSLEAGVNWKQGNFAEKIELNTER